MPDEEISAQEKSKLSESLGQVGNFLLATEFLWVAFTASFVLAAIFLNWPSFLPWLGLALGLAHFPVRLARYGYLTQRTPFDIPIVLFLISVIVGIVVSPDRWLSMGALQSFLVLTAVYYSVVNYPAPARVLKIGFPIAIVALLVFLILISMRMQADTLTKFPSGLGIGIFIVAAVAFGVAVFRQRLVLRVLSVLLGSALTAVVLVLTHSQGSLGRLFILSSLKSRMIAHWLPTLELMTGSSTWTGLGLGYWPFKSGAINNLGGIGLHVHSLYLELYANLGVLGIVAFLSAIVVGAKVCADILYVDRRHPWYGLGVGVVLACVVTLALGFIESAPLGMPAIVGGVYHYLFSPIPWLLAILLVTTRRLLREDQPAR